MLPDRVSNPGPLTYESGALPIALRGPAMVMKDIEWTGTRSLWKPDVMTLRNYYVVYV